MTDNLQSKPLEGTVSVILGGTGHIGKGLVRQHLEAGAKVIVPGRSQESLEKRAQEMPEEYRNQLITIQAQTDDFEAVQQLLADIHKEHGEISNVLASIGGWYDGEKIIETEEAAWQRNFVGPVTGHFGFARAAIPYIKKGGSYTLIQGEIVKAGTPNLTLMAMQGTAVDAFWRSLAAEVKDTVRVNVLEIGSTWSGDLSVNEVGKGAVAIAQSKISGERIPLPHRDELDKLVETLTKK